MSANQPKKTPPTCTCVGNPHGSLPPELRPRPQKASDLRKVTCPGCGLRFSTNRRTDVCMDCERKGIVVPAENTPPARTSPEALAPSTA